MEDLKEIFGTFGVIIHAYVTNRPDGSPSGNAKVCFAEAESAIRSTELDNATIDQISIKVSYLGNENSNFYRKVKSGNYSPRSSKPKKVAGLAAGSVDEGMEVENDDDIYNSAPAYTMGRVPKNPPNTPSNPLAR